MKHTCGRGRTFKKNMKTTRKQKAGAYLGQGAFGVVFAEPRIPCENESVDDLPGNEVSKIFLRRALNSAQDEANLHRRLTDGGWSESEIEKLKKYAIIPSRLCRVKNTPEENGTMWNKMVPYTSREWRTNAITGDFMGGIDLDNLPSKYPYMIISERGGNDLNIEFKKVKTTEQFYEAIIKLNNIVRGTKLLLDKDFVHPDLKNLNCIVAADRYKMIDMADVKDVTLCHDYTILSGAFMYFTWPSTNVFFEILDGCKHNSELSNSDVDRNIKQKIRSMQRYNDKDLWELIYELNLDFKEFNEDNYKYFVKMLYSYSFTEKDGFTKQQINELQKIRDCYLNEKTFGIIDTFSQDKLRRFLSTINTGEAPSEGQFQAVTRKMLSFFLQLGYNDPETLSRELFVRLELHSVGIMMLQIIFNLKNNLRNEEKNTGVNALANDEILRNQIMRLHRIACRFYLQSDVVNTDPERMKYSEKNVDGLVNIYNQFVEIISKQTDVPSVSSVSSDEESSEVPSSVSLTGDESSSGEDEEDDESE